jgi:hypothetical protein
MKTERPDGRGESPLLGLGACLVFCALGVAARGVRWDETYEHAQVLAGLVVYPAAHPLPLYLAKAFSLQTLWSTLLADMGLGAAVVCGLRNFLFLCASVMPVYFLTLALTRRVMFALAAAVLTMQGVLLAFDGSYPLMVWPELYSNGHIGTGMAVLTLAAIAAPWPRAALLLLGLMPGVHVGQAPLLFVLVPVLLVWLRFRPEAGALRGAWRWGVAGFGVSVLGYMLYRVRYATDAPIPPGLGDAAVILRAFTEQLDLHRWPPGVNLWWMMLAVLVLTYVSLLRADWTMRWPWAVLACYTGGVILLIAVVVGLQRLFGASLPVWVLQWMPYRLGNHLPPILLAGTLTLLAQSRHGSYIAAMAILAGIVTPYLGGWLPNDLYTGYLAQGEGIVFLLTGAAFGVLYPGFRALAVLLDVALLLTFYVHQFGATCMALGWLAASYWPGQRRLPEVAFVVLLVLAAAQMLLNQFRVHDTLPRTALEQAISDHTASRPLSQRAILAPPETYALQMRTGAPVLIEAATLSFLSYVPTLGPRTNALCADLYGFRLDAPGFDLGRWRTVWPERSAEDWKALASVYDFHGVLAPVDVPLALPEVARTEAGVFYRIP